MKSSEKEGSRLKLLGVAMFVAGLVLMCAQVSLTRLMAFAVSSHATFAILGAVMLGLAAAGTRVYVHRQEGRVLRGDQALARAGIAGVFALAAFVGLTAIPTVGALASLAVLCAGVFVLPFFYVGYFITLTLEDHTDDAPRLYAADLIGAALGAALSVALLDLVSPQVAILILSAACVGAATMLRPSAKSAGLLGLLLVLVVTGISFPGLMQLRYASSTHHSEMKWEGWDHLGHVAVLDYPEGLRDHVEDAENLGLSHIESADDRANFVALGWAMSREYRGEIPDTHYIRIDSGVGTPIVAADVNSSDILLWDVTAAGFVVPGQVDEAAIVGTGGGRDIMTARKVGAERIEAFEINPKVVEAVEEGFPEMSGRPYSLPGVTARIGDARAEIVGTGPFDIVSLPMTDTFSASSSGALIFSENGLYTMEAFDLFLDELNKGGVVSVSRFFSTESPGEIARIMATAREAIERRGGDPKAQVAVVFGNSLISDTSGIGNVLFKNEPFEPAELARLRDWAETRGFILLHPGPTHEGFDASALLGGQTEAFADVIYETSHIHDDRPFFYDTDKPWASTVHAFETGDFSRMSMAVRALIFLLLIITFAAKILVIDPIRTSEEGPSVGWSHWTTLFFAGLGFGFLAIEMAIIQRCTLYLGHPTYALTVVLAALLLFSSLGSWLSSRMPVVRLPTLAAVVIGVAVVSTFAQSALLSATADAAFPMRVGVVVALVFPLGTAMGTLYPTGLRLLARRGETALVPWAWAINGTLGVLATVAGMFVAMRLGYTVLFLVGALCYVGSFFAARKGLAALDETSQ